MSDTLVFIPAWNEAQNLPAVLAELRRDLPGADVLVVDDGSEDETADVARARGATVVSFPENRGLQEAIATGYGYAAKHGYAFCGRVDADGQHPVTELRRLLGVVRSGASDVAIGSRFASGAGYAERRYEGTAPRELGQAILRRLLRLRLDQPMLDPTSGLYAVNARALPYLAEPYTAGAPEVEGLLRLTDAGLRITEVPVNMRGRAGGDSKLRGRKAALLVLTVGATLLLGARLRRSPRGK